MIDLIWQFISDLPVWAIGIVGFLISLSPFPLPNETWMALITAVQGDAILPVLFVVAGIGEFIGHTIFFIVSKRHARKLTGASRSEMKVSHWFHRFGVWLFLILPTLSFMIPLTDIALLLAGHEKAKFYKIMIPLAVGIVIRTLLGYFFLDMIV
jgi:membrane protein DedA with SNARE-associated domain